MKTTMRLMQNGATSSSCGLRRYEDLALSMIVV